MLYIIEPEGKTGQERLEVVGRCWGAQGAAVDDWRRQWQDIYTAA